MTWDVGRHYTRDEIHAVLGGNMQSFLPSKNGVVVAACLEPARNPDAPTVVLPEVGTVRERTATWLCDHPKYDFPVFLKRATKRWEYVGRYRCERWTDDPDEIRKRTPPVQRDPIFRVLFLKAVE